MKPKRNPKTKQQIQDEIKKLEVLKDTLSEDWPEIIKAQLNVLKNDLNHDKIHGLYGCFGQNEAILHLALFARDWMDGRVNLLATLRNIGAYRAAILAEADYGFDIDDED